jgi:hypothetical protein
LLSRGFKYKWRTISLKTLDSLQFSDRTALNIKLKTPILLQVKRGLEVVLARYFGMPIFRCFSLKGQMLTTYQTNNTGDNVASQA